MQVAVISDLHLGSGGRADLFGHDDGDFLRFLRYLETNFEKVVLLGDIWETLTARRLGEIDLELDRARAFHKEIAATFERPRFEYLHGNHDIVAARRGAPEELLVDADGVRLLFTHGHQNDLIIRRARWLSEIGVWIGGWIRRFGLMALYRCAARGLDGLYGRGQDGGTQGAFQTWAVAAARVRSADVVVTGHTHVAGIAEHGDRLFMNSGSCAEGRYSFLAIDTQRGSYTVHDRY